MYNNNTEEPKLSPATVKVGDGVSILYWTDIAAGTVIAKTKTTITVQRDKATLSPDFKPEFVKGGFLGHVVNNDEQEYTYERDPNGQIYKCYWSNKRQNYYSGCLKAFAGRNERYDYNF